MDNKREKHAVGADREAPRPLFDGEGDELFKGPEEERKERGPIFKFTKEVEGGGEVEFVSVAGVELEINQEGEGSVFSDEEFSDFSVDEKSIDLLKRMAITARLNEPFLIEGDTDIGKSRTFEYLAHLTNNRLTRISFSGQTDVTELIGQFVPNTMSARETFLRKLQQRDQLHEDSRAILERARSEGRSFTFEESRAVADLEGLDFGEKMDWVWEDGVLPRAMTSNDGRGSWIYFDELGAAPPEILVRLNRLFERKRRIEITEESGRLVEAGQEFRIGATTNDPKYAGRRPFAPDFIRRWLYNKVPQLTPRELRQRMAFVFRGERAELPEESYTRPGVEKQILLESAPELSQHIEELLAQFHESAQSALNTGLAKGQTQPFQYEFSDILRVKKFLEGIQQEDVYDTLREAVELVYISKLGDEEARGKLLTIFDVAAEKLKSPAKIREAQQLVRPERRLEKLDAEVNAQESELSGFKEEFEEILKRAGG